jgi:signal transduction histidine kinase
MDSTSEIQVILIVTFLVFLGFVGVILYLAVNLFTKQTLLKRAHQQLEEYALKLEDRVRERTAELEASEAKYRNLFDNSKEAILIADKLTGAVIHHNKEAQVLFGRESGELTHMMLEELLPTIFTVKEAHSWRDISIRRPDQDIRIADVLIDEIHFDGKECFQVICRDITEKRDLEVQLIQAHKMADLGLFSASIAHELRTPLGSIENAGYLIREVIGNPTKIIERNLEIISNEVSRCQRIIKDLATITQPPDQSLVFTPTDINSLVGSFFSVIDKELRTRDITVAKVLQEDLPAVRTDPHRLTQVLTNLISNATQAMPSGGTLTIKTWMDKDQSTLINQDGTNHVVHISVEDTGTGIKPEDLSRIFSPFYSSKRDKDRMGLGLSISYGIVRQLKGNITVRSVRGEGSAFTVHLPVLEL